MWLRGPTGAPKGFEKGRLSQLTFHSGSNLKFRNQFRPEMDRRGITRPRQNSVLRKTKKPRVGRGSSRSGIIDRRDQAFMLGSRQGSVAFLKTPFQGVPIHSERRSIAVVQLSNSDTRAFQAPFLPQLFTAFGHPLAEGRVLFPAEERVPLLLQFIEHLGEPHSCCITTRHLIRFLFVHAKSLENGLVLHDVMVT